MNDSDASWPDFEGSGMSDYDEDEPIYPEVPGHEAGSETSAAAAARVDVVGQRADVLALYVEDATRPEPRGYTDDETEAILEARHVYDRPTSRCRPTAPRRRELQMLGFVVATGRKRPTRSGRMAQVYVHRSVAVPTEVAPPLPVLLTNEQRLMLGRLLSLLDQAAALPLPARHVKGLRTAIYDLFERAPAQYQHQLEMWPAVA